MIGRAYPTKRLMELRAQEALGHLPVCLYFWRETPRSVDPGPWVLSQWWPTTFVVNGTLYHHSEGFMMAEKASLFGDTITRDRILRAEHPSVAKMLGRSMHGLDTPIWDDNKSDVVVRGNLAKFGQRDELRDYLLKTAPAVLVEASPHDRVWGVGLTEDDPMSRHPSAWRGENLLGFALEIVRERLALEPVR